MIRAVLAAWRVRRNEPLPAPLPDTALGRNRLRQGDWRLPQRNRADCVTPSRRALDEITLVHPYVPISLTVREARRAIEDRRFARQCRRRQREARMLLHIARRYHHTVSALWASQFADVEIGTGSVVREWPYRGRSRGYCREYHTAGIRIDRAAPRARQIVICDSRSRIIRLPAVPVALARAWSAEAPHPVGLLAARTADPDIVACWAPIDGRWGVIALACRGVAIPQTVAAGSYTAADVLAEANSQVRAVMTARYPGGAERLIADLGLEPLQQDDFGRLYQLPGGRQGIVQVTDATPGPDGTHRVHWLCVPPTMRTARDAVAWTFDVEPEAYAPQLEA
jgi:hypothetical protein